MHTKQRYAYMLAYVCVLLYRIIHEKRGKSECSFKNFPVRNFIHKYGTMEYFYSPPQKYFVLLKSFDDKYIINIVYSI